MTLRIFPTKASELLIFLRSKWRGRQGGIKEIRAWGKLAWVEQGKRSASQEVCELVVNVFASFFTLVFKCPGSVSILITRHPYLPQHTQPR